MMRLACVALIFVSGVAQAGARHVARARPRLVGLDAGLPRDGGYARGIAADMDGRFGDAVRAYDDALGELDGLAAITTSDDRADAWRRKIVWQREQSEAVLEEE